MVRPILSLAILCTAVPLNAQFSAKQIIEWNELPSMGSSVAADLNGDGANDLITCSAFKGIAHFMNDGMGNFGEVQFDDTTSFSGFAISLVTGDMDNDG